MRYLKHPRRKGLDRTCVSGLTALDGRHGDR